MPAFKDRTGETRTMKSGLKATITRYGNFHDMDIEFENGQLVHSKNYEKFRVGSIKCPMVIECVDDYAQATNANISPNFIFLMDIEDLPILEKYLWCPVRGYAHNKFAGGVLHRLIMNAKSGEDVDHINGNILDNRKGNLRICAQADNAKNVSTRIHSVSGYKGVSWHPQNQKWRARIVANKIKYEVGSFDTAQEAAIAYNEAAIKYHGEFARLNEL